MKTRAMEQDNALYLTKEISYSVQYLTKEISYFVQYFWQRWKLDVKYKEST